MFLQFDLYEPVTALELSLQDRFGENKGDLISQYMWFEIRRFDPDG
jgi:hypothetical protein